MMRLRIFVLGYLLLASAWGQAQPDILRKTIPELPFISPEKAGFQPDSLNKLLNLIQDTPPNDFRGLVLIKNKQIVLEEYFNTFWRNSIHDIRSAGKSVTSLLLGIAMQEGMIQNLDQDFYSFLVDKYPSLNPDFKKIKLRDLLNMASGLDADTDRSQTPGHAVNWIARDDWREYILGIPLKRKAGKKWIYADIHPLLIAAIIEEKSGMSLKDYAQKKLFAPLGIDQYYWYSNAAKQTGAAGNLYLSTLDFAKLGVLVANEGKWKDKQILAPEYLKELFEQQIALPKDYPAYTNYSLFWYKTRGLIQGKEVNYIYASGNGGNHLVVIPDLDLVIALTSSAYGQRYAHRRSFGITRKILEAIK